jgi:hypothetical protein
MNESAQTPQRRVFVSYELPDGKVGGLLVKALDQRGIVADVDLSLKLAREHPDASMAIVVLSLNSANLLLMNIEAMIHLNWRMVIPVTLGGLDALPEEFRGIRAIDLSGWSGDPDDPRFVELENAVRARLNLVTELNLARFSQSVRAVRERLLSAGPVTALRVVEEIRLLHAEYGNGLFGRLTLSVEDGERTSADDWLVAVAEASPADAAIAGRTVVLRLAELDPTVKSAIPREVLNAIFGEVYQIDEPVEKSAATGPDGQAVEPVLVGTVDSDLVEWDKPLVDRLRWIPMSRCLPR